MNRTLKIIASSCFLSCALLIGVATPSSVDGTAVFSGHGAWEVPGGDTVSFTVSAVELPDGSLVGHGISSRTGEAGKGWVHFDVTDFMEFEGGLAVAGIITKAHDAPEELVGTQVVLLALDDGQEDRAISGIGIPPYLSLEDILFAPPPFGPPPPDYWFPLSAGNFTIH